MFCPILYRPRFEPSGESTQRSLAKGQSKRESLPVYQAVWSGYLNQLELSGGILAPNLRPQINKATTTRTKSNPVFGVLKLGMVNIQLVTRESLGE